MDNITGYILILAFAVIIVYLLVFALVGLNKLWKNCKCVGDYIKLLLLILVTTIVFCFVVIMLVSMMGVVV